MKKIVFVFILALVSHLIYSQNASVVKLFCDKNKSSITYSMNHILHAWTGISKEVTSVILTDENRNTITQVAVSVKVSSFDSDNANRDSHALEVTEALKFPAITFSSTSILEEGNKLKVKGTMNFHGVNQTVSFDAQKKVTGNKVQVTGSFSVTMTQFKIEPPTLMGISTDDEIKLTFDISY